MNAARKPATAESTDRRIQPSLGALRGALLELLVEKSFEQISIIELTLWSARGTIHILSWWA